jgi:hypothetical protein
VALPKRIGSNLLTPELWELINASTKIFPITYEDVINNSNPHGYEFGRINSGEYKNTIYYWNKELNRWEIIGADDLEIYWQDIKDIPASFRPIAHSHATEDVIGLNDLIDDTIEELSLTFASKIELDSKVDKIPGKGLSEEDFTSELKLYLLSLSENATVDYKYMVQLLQDHMEDTSVHLTSALINLINAIPGKAEKTTLNEHIGNTSIHVTASNKENWDNKAEIELSEFASSNPGTNTWWYEDLGETADLGGGDGGLLLGNASTEEGDDVWFDEV